MPAYSPHVAHSLRSDGRTRNKAGFAHPARNVGALSVQPGMVIADFGAGAGHYTLAFAWQLAGSGRIYAIDVQQDLLRRIKAEAAAHGLPGVEIIHGDVARPHGSKLSDASTDLVLISNLLFQLEEPAGALKEAWRVVRPSGKVAVIDWSDSYRSMGPSKAHVRTKEKALALAQQCNFELVREFPAGAHHYGLILKPTPRDRV